MLGERKKIRIDRYDYVATAYGSKKREIVESSYVYGFVKYKGGKVFDGVSVIDTQDVSVAFHVADVKDLSVNDLLTIDNLRYVVNTITRERFQTTVTCKADRR
jgi:hypothetical protein